MRGRGYMARVSRDLPRVECNDTICRVEITTRDSAIRLHSEYVKALELCFLGRELA